MGCPHCESADTSERRERTALGYRRFRCHTCQREFNERTGTRFNHLQYPTDVVCLVVLWRVRFRSRRARPRTREPHARRGDRWDYGFSHASSDSRGVVAKASHCPR